SSHAVADWQIGRGTNIDLKQLGTIQNGGIIVDNINYKFQTSQDIAKNSFLYGIADNQTGSDLTINNNSSIEFYATNGPMIKVGGNATAGIITNSGTLIRERFGGLTNYKPALDMGTNAYAQAFINNGRMYWAGTQVIALWGNSHIGTIRNTGTIQTEGVAIGVGSSGTNNVTIDSIELEGGLIQHIDNSSSANNVIPTAGDVINLANNANVGKIIVSNSASIHGNISLSRTTITDKISFSDSNMTGNISLGGSRIANGISIDGSNISGNISLAANNGTHSTITNGFSIDDSKITGNISIANQSTIANGLSLSGNSTIANLNLTERGNIDTLSLNQGTITGGISLTGNADGTGTNTATIGEITLENSSTITGNISVKGDGASNNANAKIGNITLEDGTGIGGSIAVGDSNGAANTNGEIAGITLYGNSTIAGGIINNANGNIGTIVSNTGTNVNNTITNHGTIGSLEVNNQGTIVYKSDNGIITDALSVASGATLDIKNTSNNTGTIELKSDSATLEDGSTLNLANGSTLVGHLKNSGNLGDWTNESNIQGHFINEGTIGELNAGNIAEYLQNSGVIKILKQGKITGTLNNTGTIGELNTSVINYNSNTNTATIVGAGHYGILNIDKNTIMDNNNTITNALKVDKNNSGNGYTLTINNGGGGGNGTIYIKFDTDAQVGTINNLGTILGNIDNQASSIIKTFNTGSISGSIINNAGATIETLKVTGNVANGITNNSNIGSLIVNENVSYSGSGSISNALEVAEGDTLTATNGITFSSANGTINNAGTINGNITNIADSILTDFTNSGSISGTFTNKGHIVKFVNTNTGSINNFVNDKTISFFENNGIITSFNGNNGTIYGVINSKTITNGFENVATSLWNKENALITGNVALKGDYKDCSNSGSTICNTSDLINEGTITGNVTNEAGKEINLVENTGTIGGSIANSGSINTLEVSGTIAQGIINNDNASISSIIINEGANLGNSGITNNSNIGTLKVYESVNYTGNGSDRITQALEVAKDKTLTIQNSGSSNGTLSFNSKNGNVNNLGIIAGNLSNVSNSTLGTFINSGTINGDINNEGTITSIDNSGVITGEIVSGSSGQTSQIDKIINTGTIGTAKTKVATFKTLAASNQDVSSNFSDAISLNTITTTEISNGGLINGNIRVKGQSDIQELNNTDTIDGCIILEGGRIGNINNTNGAIANCMSFSSGANVDNLNNDGTVSGTITNDSGSITVNNGGSGFIGGITTSNGGTTNISNGGFKNPGGNIGLITNDGSNSKTNIIEWNVGNPDNPNSPIKVAGTNLGGINTGTIYVDVTPGKVYDVEQIVVGEDGDGVDSKGDSLADQLNNGQGIFDSLHHASDIITIVDEGGGEFSAGVDTQELSGKTLGASLIYSSRMRQINTNSMLREINVKNFKTDFEILEQRERLKNQQALLENYKQQRESYLNGLTKDNKELKRVSSK
ncbi:beta strand repeat-containing protein, partial [Helicobacter pullorum]|uniref:beta strand repeat-containing protein n=1 Tax=Helicobacter pullorum TaxID=35818 RepID=UPI0015CF6E2D